MITIDSSVTLTIKKRERYSYVGDDSRNWKNEDEYLWRLIAGSNKVDQSTENLCKLQANSIAVMFKNGLLTKAQLCDILGIYEEQFVSLE